MLTGRSTVIGMNKKLRRFRAWVKLTHEERLAILAKLTGHDPQWPYTTPEFKQTAESLVADGLVICTEHNVMVVFRAIALTKYVIAGTAKLLPKLWPL